MKKILTAVLLISMLLTACATPSGTGDTADSPTPPTGTEQSAGEPQTTPDGAVTNDAVTDEDGEFERRIMSPADVFGVVTNVVGNEITLKLIEPLNNEIRIGEGFPGGAAEFDPENLPEGFEMPEGFELPEGFEMPEGGFQGRVDGNFQIPEGFDMENMPQIITGGGTGGSRGARVQDIEVEVTYTGEQTDVTIPVGVIQTMPTKKQIVMLWLDDDGEIINALVMGKASN